MLEREDSADSGTHNSIASETSTSPRPSRSVSESDGYASAGSTEEPEGQPDRIGETSSPPNSVPVDNSVSSNSNPAGSVSNELRPVVPSVSATQDRGSATPSDTVLDILEEMDDEGQDIPGQISVVMPDTRTEDPAHEMSDAVKVNMPESVEVGPDSGGTVLGSSTPSDPMDDYSRIAQAARSKPADVSVDSYCGGEDTTIPKGDPVEVCPDSGGTELDSSAPSDPMDDYSRVIQTTPGESAGESVDSYCGAKDTTVPDGEPAAVGLDSGGTELDSSTPSDPMDDYSRVIQTPPGESAGESVDSYCGAKDTTVPDGEPAAVGLDSGGTELDSSTPSDPMDDYSRVIQTTPGESAGESVDSYCGGKDTTVPEGEPAAVGLDSGDTLLDSGTPSDSYCDGRDTTVPEGEPVELTYNSGSSLLDSVFIPNGQMYQTSQV